MRARRIARAAAALACLAALGLAASWAAIALGGMIYVPLAWIATALYLREAGLREYREGRGDAARQPGMGSEATAHEPRSGGRAQGAAGLARRFEAYFWLPGKLFARCLSGRGSAGATEEGGLGA